ncbi:MFS transporter [Microbacterium laevaniformans]|uniref:MFS transporter n=1 Tax=Microbacterium laevaniformans TaxID=36807 RepID=UPI00363115FB
MRDNQTPSGETPSESAPPLLPGATASSTALPPSLLDSAEPAEAAAHPTHGAKVRGWWTLLLVLAQIGGSIALITPLAISMAVRLQQLAPQHSEYLGYITSAGALGALVVAPLAGILSDRTRTRMGRRTPFIAGGAILGLVALAIMAAAPNVFLLGVGWVLAQLTWATANGALVFVIADRVPERQRASVSGLNGFASLVAPVLGSIIGAMLVSDIYLLFLVPGVIGLMLMLLFAFVGAREDVRALPPTEGKLGLGGVLRNYLFSPRKHPDFAWNWLGRFLFMAGLTIATTFGTFFAAERLTGGDVAAVAGIAAILGLGGVVAAAFGALGGGFVADKLRRRKLLVFISGILFAAGAVTTALAYDMPTFLAGGVVMQLGIGIFSAVDTAVILDIIPDPKASGRFLGIAQLAISLAQSTAPLIASLLLLLVSPGGQQNYTPLFYVAGVITVVGGGIILTRVKGSR